MRQISAFAEIPRTKVIQRLTSSGAKLIWLIAGAGFGKTTVARQFGEGFRRSLICDCTSTADPVDLADRLLTALAADDDKRTALLAAQKLSRSTDVDQWIDSALAEWVKRSDSELFVFENAEGLASSGNVVALFRKFLARREHGRTTMVCSRIPIEQYIRGIAPHETITLREQDLAFDRGEIRSLFPTGSLSEQREKRVAEASQGWPIAVLLLSRFALMDDLESAVDRLDAVAADALEDYVVNEILSGLSSAQHQLLVLVSAIPEPTLEDIKLLLAETKREDLVDAISSLPFVNIDSNGAIIVHPLVRAAIRQDRATKLEVTIRSLANVCMQSRRFCRAGLLFASIGDFDAAAAAVEPEGTLFAFNPSLEYAKVVQSLDVETLLRHPGLWAASTPCRSPIISKQQWLEEAKLVWNRLRPDVPDAVRLGIASAYANVLANLGRYSEGLSVLQQASDARTSRPTGAEIFLEGMLKTALFSRPGSTKKALEIWDAISPLCTSKSSEALVLSELHARVARAEGNRPLEQAILDRAIALVRLGGAGVPASCFPYMEAAFGAWFAGEDGLCARYVSELIQLDLFSARPAFELFVTCAQGSLDSIEDSVEHPRHRCYAYLVAAGRASNDVRTSFASRAVDAADLSGEYLLRVTARIAKATVSSSEKKMLLAEALDIARQSDVNGFAQTVENVVIGKWKGTIFAPMMCRLRSAVEEQQVTVRIRVLDNQVHVNDTSVALTDRESELLMFLAAAHREVLTQELADALWPDSNKDARDTGLRVYVSRLRMKLRAKGLISVSPRGYRLAPEVLVDVLEIERHLNKMHRSPTLTEAEVEQLHEDLMSLCKPRPPAMLVWRWFSVKTQDYQQMARDLGICLTREANRRRGFDATLGYARLLLQADPCDETACKIAIQAHLSKGDKAGAALELRRFRETLKHELGVRPSADIEALIQGSASQPAKLA